MKITHCLLAVASLVAFLLAPLIATAYPLDDYERTGIRRLEFYRLAQLGELSGRQLPDGAKLTANEIKLAYPSLPRTPDGHVLLPQSDLSLSEQITEFLMPDDQPRYGIAVLDYTDTENPVYAEHNGQYKSNVGSVGKLLVGASLFHQLAQAWPNDIPQRENVLRNTMIIADEYSRNDHHSVPIFDVARRELDYRRLRVGDEGSLWEFLDWMFSASSNAAASMVVQQTTLLKQFGAQYPMVPEQRQAWLDDTPWKEEGEVMVSALVEGLQANGLDTTTIRQGSYFTGGGKRSAAGTNSYATPHDLVRLLAMLETGTLVDDWSSAELKRLLYMTQRRIRYASHPALNDSAVFFKSGSLYSCQEEPGFICRKYRGNKLNILASVAIVESPADIAKGLPPLRYAVAVVSNVLYKNSAVAHQTLAMRIHRALQARHSDASPVAQQ